VAQEHLMRETMNAADICKRIVTIAERGMSLTEAAQLMRDRHVGCLVVVDETGAGRIVVGILTDRDIVTAVVAKALNPAQLVVEDVMTTDMVTALEADSIKDMLSTMRRKGLRRLPVVTPQGVLIGLVTLDDLLPIMAEQLRDMAATIEAEFLHERKVRS
jgi:CBS domain-containing protein